MPASPRPDSPRPASPRPASTDAVTDAKPGRLKKRAEFLRAASSGKKAAIGGVVLQALPRSDDLPARLGFTVTKKVGNAVIRNRTRRRLKEAARLLLAQRPVTGVDLVLIGRDSTRKRNFITLQGDIRRALERTGV
ncbi:MAG TPA: ribonuclease P protein component [Acetobacteraceae bacterium]|jgi:ribonuclease P protein component|nr:ribonuclease P protein component [Acetobacteraceae bacterium]